MRETIGEILKSLALGLEEVRGDWKVIPDNFVIKIRGESLNEQRFVEAREKLRNKEVVKIYGCDPDQWILRRIGWEKVE